MYEFLNKEFRQYRLISNTEYFHVTDKIKKILFKYNNRVHTTKKMILINFFVIIHSQLIIMPS